MTDSLEHRITEDMLFLVADAAVNRFYFVEHTTKIPEDQHHKMYVAIPYQEFKELYKTIKKVKK